MWLLLLLCFFFPFLANSDELPKGKVPYIENKVKIDGVLEEDCWKNSLKISDFIITWGAKKDLLGKKPKNQTVCYLFYDKDYFYVGVECYDDNIEGLMTEKMEERDGGWGDDCIEMFIDPGLTRKRFFQYIINPAGIIFDQKCEDAKQMKEWDSGIEYAVKKYKDRWVVETKIPLAELELKKDTGEIWGFNITRFEPNNWIVQSWAPVFGGNSQPDKFGVLEGISLDWNRYTLELNFTSWGNLSIGDDYIEFSIKNLSENKMDLTGETFSDGKLSSRTNFVIKPGETKNLSLGYSIEERDGKLSLFIKNQKGEVCYIKTKYFKIPDRFIDLKEFLPIYYLSENSIPLNLYLNIGRLSLEKCEIIFDITDQNNKSLFIKKVSGIKDRNFKVPLFVKDIPAGKFNLKMILKINGKEIDEKIVGFERIKGPFD